MHPESLNLRPFQDEGKDFCSKLLRSILALDQGLGKTATALMSLGDRGLVVCPPGLKYGWADECRKWRQDLKPIVMEGMGLARFKWPDRGELVIVGYNQLPDEFEIPPWRAKFEKGDSKAIKKKKSAAVKKAKEDFNKYMARQAKFGLLTQAILDEVQYGKNPKSTRSKKVKALVALCKQTMALTGTPMPRGNPGDTYGILQALHLEDEVFGSWNNFKRVANWRQESGTYGTPTPEFHKLLSKVMFRRTKAQVASFLPKKIYKTLPVALDSRTESLLDALPAEIVDGVREAQDASGLTKLQTLPGFSEFAKCRKQIAQARIPAMLEILETYEAEETRTLVFSAHRDPILALENRPGWRVIHGGISAAERQEIVRDQEKLQGVGITIKAGAAGLNLKSFHNALYVDLDWDITQNRQAEDRCHRLNSEGEFVMYTTLTSTHPIDILITEKLQMASRNIDVAIEGKS